MFIWSRSATHCFYSLALRFTSQVEPNAADRLGRIEGSEIGRPLLSQLSAVGPSRSRRQADMKGNYPGLLVKRCPVGKTGDTGRSRVFLYLETLQSLEPSHRGAAGPAIPSMNSIPKSWPSDHLISARDTSSGRSYLGMSISTARQSSFLTMNDVRTLHPAIERRLGGTVTKTVTTEKQEVGEKAEAVDLVVRPTGLEPVTPRSVVWCSIH